MPVRKRIIETEVRGPVGRLELPADAQLIAQRYTCHVWTLSFLADEGAEPEKRTRYFVSARMANLLPAAGKVTLIEMAVGQSGKGRYLFEVEEPVEKDLVEFETLSARSIKTVYAEGEQD